MNREVRVPPETPYGAAVEALLSDVSSALVRHLDFRPSCQVTRDGAACGKDASFAMRCLHCGDVRLQCAEHVAIVKQFATRCRSVGCMACRRYREDLSDLFEFVPLGLPL